MQYSPEGQINHTVHTSSSKKSQFNFYQSEQGLTEHQFSPLLLQNRVNQHKQNRKNDKKNLGNSVSQLVLGQDEDEIQFINSNSIVKRYQLLLISCLIISSIASVKYSSEGHLDHIKTIRDYFNSYLLGNSNRAIYQYGDNIDQSDLELQIFQDMNEHFDNFIQVFNNFTEIDSFTYFDKISSNNVVLSYSFFNQTNFKEDINLQNLQSFLFFMDRRSFLLNLKQMEISINLGRNQRIDSLNISVSYDLSSRMLLNVELQFQYTPNSSFIKIQQDNTIRIVEQFLAFFLLVSYLNNAYKIKIENNRLIKKGLFYDDIRTLQKNRAYWCYSLALLNIITMLTQTYAPLSSFLQLLPIFQRHDSANIYKYNFNTNIRYALPLVMRIFIPVVIMLNGFVFYSMLMYPGDYFEDYSMALFSYVYQNFQVGTYQIFVQLESRGNFAYALYAILYFYMVLVGSNLLPALFCTMIYIKIYQNDLKDHITKTLKTAICPRCNHCNFDDTEDQKMFELNISSPKISPYLKGKLSTVSQNKSEIQLIKKVTQMYVEPELVEHNNEKEYMKAKVIKIKTFRAKFENILKQTKSKRQLILFQEKIDKLVEDIEQSIFLTPLRSPKKY